MKIWYNKTIVKKVLALSFLSFTNLSKKIKERRMNMTNVNVVNNVPDINVNIDKSKSGISITITQKLGKSLKDYKPGETAKIGDREYIVLEQMDDKTAVLDKNVVEKMEFGKDAKWNGSNVEKYCEGEYYNSLAKVVGKDNILSHTVDLMCDDGSNKGVFSTNNVSVLTPELYRKYRELIPLVDISCWTPNGVTVLDEDYARCVCIVICNGILDWGVCDWTHGVRPFCILKSNVLTSQLDE